MKTIYAVVPVVLLSMASWATAADLELFSLKLADAPSTQMREAAIRAGARPVPSKGPVAKFDASRMGLPGAKTLEVTSVNAKVMTAQYAFDNRGEEKLRKMLLAKYGTPQEQPRPFMADFDGQPKVQDFGAQYVEAGRYVWKFDDGMQLVFRKEFMRDNYLTYVNTKLLAAVEQAAQKGADNGAKADAANLKNSF